jgi:adenosylcobinamide-GDP ribazoletransferase
MTKRLGIEGRAFHAALRFFTRLPLDARKDWDVADDRRAMAWFPSVGWIVGAMGGLVWWLAARVWPPEIASGMSLAATVLLTGALHEDGWADVCDGAGGGATPERMREIMRDPRLGAFGVIGLVVVLGLKWNSIAALPGALVPATLLAAHAISRGAAVSLMATLDYAAGSGKTRQLAGRLLGGRLCWAVACAVLPLVLLPWRTAVVGLIVVMTVRHVAARWLVHRLGGYTGDALGATQQVTEVAFYLAVLALA